MLRMAEFGLHVGANRPSVGAKRKIIIALAPRDTKLVSVYTGESRDLLSCTTEINWHHGLLQAAVHYHGLVHVIVLTPAIIIREDVEF